MSLLRSAALTLIASLVSACGGPGIPHPVASTEDTSCLACHRSGASGAPRTPHPDEKGCVDCHPAP